MNIRPLSPVESKNLACLNETGQTNALLFVTPTGLDKAILDATDPVRRLFLEAGFHDYTRQKQGPDNKVLTTALMHELNATHEVGVSLYRPQTKQGDPRIWFSRFDRHVSGGDVCALFFHDARLHVLNLSRTPLHDTAAREIASPLLDFFRPLLRAAQTVADELLAKLREIAARGPIRAVCQGDTAIGRSIETALEIRMNSSRDPDHQGSIELKSGRSALEGHENRASLFACVPDWTLSRCKSSAGILKEFGYEREGQFKLYCEVSTQRPNSQGLILEIETAERWLKETCKQAPVRNVAIWRLEHLEQRLAAKHKETFWVKAHSRWEGAREYFELVSVTHTRNPNIPQFERLLDDGTITLDHLIKRTPSGGAHEKGPLFKIERPRLHELFLGEPRVYQF